MADGLPTNEFSRGAALCTADGFMVFGSAEGVTIFHPDSVRDNPFVPPVVLTDFSVYDRSVATPSVELQRRGIRLSYDERFFSFEFAALSFRCPEKNLYSYTLEGFDRGWHAPGPGRLARYTNVPPGEYLFRIRGSNDDGLWNPTGIAIPVSIDPPFWQTWWFRLILLLALVPAVYAVDRIRRHQVLMVERLRQRIARDLHDDIGTNLSAIVIGSRFLASEKSLSRKGRGQIDEIRNITLQTQEMMREIVWMLNPSNDSTGLFLGRLKESAARVLRGKRVIFEAPGEETLRRLSLEFKRHLLLFFREAVNNVARHAEATEVLIRFHREGDFLTLTIRDNGKGFDASSQAPGNGLRNMRARGESLAGVVNILSSPGNGTEITLRVKMT
jgi:signal transduction histidine kinase